MTSDSTAVHPEPVWRDRADFIISCAVKEIEGFDDPREQLWARQVAEFQFEVCCIPFFLIDVSLGDIVETDESYLMTHVVQQSGRCTFRVQADIADDHHRTDLLSALQRMGALVEWSSESMFAVDAENDQLAQAVADLLHDGELSGHWTYETARTRPE